MTIRVDEATKLIYNYILIIIIIIIIYYENSWNCEQREISKRRTIPKLDSFLRTFVILQIFFFFNLIVNKFLNFWQLFRKLSNFHNRIFFEFTNLQKFINVLNLRIHRFYKFKIFQYLQNLFIIKNFKNPKNIKWKII